MTQIMLLCLLSYLEKQMSNNARCLEHALNNKQSEFLHICTKYLHHLSLFQLLQHAIFIVCALLTIKKRFYSELQRTLSADVQKPVSSQSNDLMLRSLRGNVFMRDLERTRLFQIVFPSGLGLFSLLHFFKTRPKPLRSFKDHAYLFCLYCCCSIS